MSLYEKAMLVELSISQWTARKQDKESAAFVAQHKGADEAYLAASKRLVDKSYLAPISTIANEARQYLYRHTLPWNDSGHRLLPAAKFLEFTEAMREFRTRFDRAVAEFMDGYAQAIREAQLRLNGLFNQLEYPTQEQLHNKFSFETLTLPIPFGSDFRVQLGQEEEARIRREIEDATAKRFARAKRDCWQRLQEPISHMAATLAEDGKIFRNSLVQNVLDAVDAVRSLNIDGDPRLNQVLQTIEARLSVDPDTLRESPHTRAVKASEASAILADMATFMGS